MTEAEFTAVLERFLLKDTRQLQQEYEAFLKQQKKQKESDLSE